jgi:predicted transcriptional regulator
MLKSVDLQIIVKGFANHHRIDVLRLLFNKPDLSVEEIANTLKVNYKTISVHVRQLNRAGLIEKHYLANYIEHKLTRRGLAVLKFLGKLE